MTAESTESTAETATPVVLVEDRGPVRVITLNRPQAKNAIDASVARALADAVDELEAAPQLSVGVLTGAGGTFCAGFDLNAFLRGETATIPGRGFGGIAEMVRRKPLIAAVEGWALAGGWELVLSCDLVVAAEDARFGLPEAKRGLVAAGGGLVRLPRRMPYLIALEVGLTGDPLPAPRAAQFGLVNRLSPSGEALEDAIRLAEQIGANAPLALQATREIMAIAQDGSEVDAFARQRSIVRRVFASADSKEGALAFKEKRTPRWTGR
jgi:enoyl-CoA hydratase